MTTTTNGTRRRGLRAIAVIAAITLVLAACGGDDDDDDGASAEPDGSTETSAATGPVELAGLFSVAAGACTDAGVTDGSYFRMVQGGGALDAGPFVENLDSPCGDKTWNPLLPGSDGGLRTGGYQPFPDPPFDGAGNATAALIVQPVKFFAVTFAVGTNETDPQTGVKAAAPTLTADAGAITGDLAAFAAAWNSQHFNQGSPKPDGSKPGITTDVSGTYDAATGAFTLDWASQIVGGPFNNFTGRWHFEGTFEGTVSSSPATVSTGSGGSGKSGGSASGAGSGAVAGSSGQRNPNLANTGLSVPTGRGAWLLTAGLVGCSILSRTRRLGARSGAPTHG